MLQTRMSSQEQIIRLLAEPRNRAILSSLNDAAQSLTVDELAEQLISCGAISLASPVDDDEREHLQISLHHRDLPRLAEAGLVAYDPDQNIVEYENYPSVEAEWLETEMFDELLSCFEPILSASEETIGMVEGREDVIEYGRYLLDEADDELFLMCVGTDLFEDECVRCAKNAMDRGVNVYVGSHNPEVRDFARNNLPEATIWEPQLDWMNNPSQYPTVGRLVFADREKLMLAMLDDPDSTDSMGVNAIVGDGAENPLVVLVRELLGSRLDHLDYQSSDFLEELPFEP